MSDQVTAHQLGRILLELEDLPVYARDADYDWEEVWEVDIDIQQIKPINGKPLRAVTIDP